MTVNVSPLAIESLPLTGYGAQLRRSIFGEFRARLVFLPAIAIAGCVAWMMLSGSGDAEGQSAPAASPAVAAPQNPSRSNPVVTPTEANLAPPAEATAPPERPRPPNYSPWKGRRSTGSGFHRSPGAGAGWGRKRW